MEEQQPDVYSVHFEIQDAGSSKRRLLFQSYSLSTKKGMDAFEELLQATRSNPAPGQLELAFALEQTRRVRVEHRTAEGRTYANAVAHRALDAET